MTLPAGAMRRAKDGATEAAIALYRRAIAANEKDANSHFNVGLENALSVQLDPSLASAAAARRAPGIK
jgi:hypothetical protein